MILKTISDWFSKLRKICKHSKVWIKRIWLSILTVVVRFAARWPRVPSLLAPRIVNPLIILTPLGRYSVSDRIAVGANRRPQTACNWVVEFDEWTLVVWGWHFLIVEDASVLSLLNCFYLLHLILLFTYQFSPLESLLLHLKLLIILHFLW